MDWCRREASEQVEVTPAHFVIVTAPSLEYLRRRVTSPCGAWCGAWSVQLLLSGAVLIATTFKVITTLSLTGLNRRSSQFVVVLAFSVLTSLPPTHPLVDQRPSTVTSIIPLLVARDTLMMSVFHFGVSSTVAKSSSSAVCGFPGASMLIWCPGALTRLRLDCTPSHSVKTIKLHVNAHRPLA